MKGRVAAAAAAVLALVALLWFPVLENGFVSWDDDRYVTRNPLIRELSGENLRAIATSFVSGNYHPVTMISLALEHRLFGTDPRGYHATNLLLHLVNTFLAFLLIRGWAGASLPAALVGGLLFGVHPLRVESVAWVADRKDLLSALFALVSLLGYRAYRERGGVARYLLTLGAFVLAVLSKAGAVVLPLLYLLDDYCTSRRIGQRSALEKVPFLAVSVAAGVTAIAARSSFQEALAEEPFTLSRGFPLQAQRIVLYFLARVLLPWRRGFLYDDPAAPSTFASPAVLASAAVLIALALGVALSLRRTRVVLRGAGFFLVALSPVLAATVLGYSADRFTYLPLLGLCYLCGEGAAALWRRAGASGPARALLLAGAVAVFASLSHLSRQRIPVWRDDLSLWSDAVAAYPDPAWATPHVRRGRALVAAGDPQGALADAERVLGRNPGNPEALHLAGVAKAALGRAHEGLRDLSAALEKRPHFPAAYNDRGNVLRALNLPVQALADYAQAMEQDPSFGDAWYNRGTLLLSLGDLDGAAADLGRVPASDPAFARARNNRGIALLRKDARLEALADFDLAIAREPGYAGAWHNRARLHRELGDSGSAARDARRAAELGYPVPPGSPDAPGPVVFPR